MSSILFQYYPYIGEVTYMFLLYFWTLLHVICITIGSTNQREEWGDIEKKREVVKPRQPKKRRKSKKKLPPPNRPSKKKKPPRRSKRKVKRKHWRREDVKGFHIFSFIFKNLFKSFPSKSKGKLNLSQNFKKKMEEICI